MKECAQFFGPSIILKEVMEFLQSWHRCKWAYDQLPHSSGFITHERETCLRSITVQQWNQLQNMDVKSSWGRQLYLEQIELWSTSYNELIIDDQHQCGCLFILRILGFFFQIFLLPWGRCSAPICGSLVFSNSFHLCCPESSIQGIFLRKISSLEAKIRDHMDPWSDPKLDHLVGPTNPCFSQKQGRLIHYLSRFFDQVRSDQICACFVGICVTLTNLWWFVANLWIFFSHLLI